MKMKKNVIRSIAIVAAAALSTGSLLAAGNGGVAKSCTGLVVSADGNPGHGKASFSATGDAVLHFHFVVPASVQVDTKDLVTIRLTTPNGHHYQTLDLPVAPAGSAETQRQIHGYAFPLPVQQFASSNSNGKGALHVAGSIPLAGSTIANYSLFGKWTAEAQLGTGSPCSASFTVTP